MSRILQKLKRKSLFEELQERFPTELVQPFGEVLIIPSKRFKNEWKERLEAEGIKTYISNFGSQVSFFLRKVDQKKQAEPSSIIEEPPVQKVEADSKPLPVKEKKPWTQEEKAILKRLYREGVAVKEIAKKLDRSSQSVGGIMRHFKFKFPEEKEEMAPRLKKRKGKREETKSKSNDPNLVKELLSACSLLYPSHPQTCRFLLKEILSMMVI